MVGVNVFDGCGKGEGTWGWRKRNYKIVIVFF